MIYEARTDQDPPYQQASHYPGLDFRYHYVGLWGQPDPRPPSEVWPVWVWGRWVNGLVTREQYRMPEGPPLTDWTARHE